MTLIAGIVSRRDRAIPESACQDLRSSISRHADEGVAVFKDDHGYFVHLDIGAFDGSGTLVDPNGAFSMLAGEPLLNTNETSGQSREKHLQLIHRELMQQRFEIMQAATGTFCAITYDPRSRTLRLIADKLGVRPLYYWVDANYLVFAGALRILEELSLVPKTMDVRAVAEVAVLGAPLGNRTPYANIMVLRPAEILCAGTESVNRCVYWRWDELESSGRSEADDLREVYERFQSAVRSRIKNARTALAYLSGGMDSRCVVAALAREGVAVHTFDFARPGTQDQIFGNAFAEKIGSIHQEIPKNPGDQIPDYALLLSQTWHGASPSAPLLAWSGEGGSVGLGYVHLTQAIVDLMRAGKTAAAIEEFFQLEYVRLPEKLFKPKAFKILAGLIKEGVKAELDDLQSSDPARNFHLFLMLNDQRRKLANHFENIDLHRVEFQLPFFDADFLSAVCAVPVELCLYHRFYAKWLSHFPSAVTSVPWQTYPDHEPCPLPTPSGLAYQWDNEYQATERAAQKQKILARAQQVLSGADFPREILSRRNLRMATWIHMTGWRDYEHVIRIAHAFYSYSKACKGNYLMPIIAAPTRHRMI